MIVDDEPLERKGMRKIIERDYTNINIVEDAYNGTEAIKKAKLFQPDIILMDIRMPETNGLEAQKNIIKVIPNVKTIIITAYNDFNYAQEAIKHGAIDYLLKPVKPRDLKISIEKALQHLTKNNSSIKQVEVVNEGDNEDVMKNAIKYIHEHLSGEIKLKKVAEVVHLNSQYFSRYFKKETGLTFTYYVTKLRIEKAKNLLIQTNQPMYRIAIEAGFTDAAYFSKVFYKLEQTTPYQYKKQNKVAITY